ncbi:hypothetical protein ABGB14_22790 [Nonomuraea sp. B10E15]|uniref:hypothetical protein n=1 Tax=Nonomuraea sp. B10E15 TaxID=3153560 RepID=UPI00325E7671
MSADAKELAEELRRAAELRALHSVRADNGSKQAQAAATLIQVLDGTEQAVVMVGSVLVIKDAGDDPRRRESAPAIRAKMMTDLSGVAFGNFGDDGSLR